MAEVAELVSQYLRLSNEKRDAFIQAVLALPSERQRLTSGIDGYEVEETDQYMASARLTITSLPPELIMYIFRFLDGVNLAKVALVSRTWHALSKDATLWQSLFRERYQLGLQGKDAQFPVNIPWKKAYIYCFTNERKWKATSPIPNDFSPTMWAFAERILYGHPPDEFSSYVHKARHATPIWYRFDESRMEWKWTPDREFWMSCDTVTVVGGWWSGQQPVPENRRLISWLQTSGVVPRYLQIVFNIRRQSDVELENLRHAQRAKNSGGNSAS
jgi:hypothetical protein